MASPTFSQPNAKTFTVDEIVSEVLAGRVRVPSFQRTFRWRWEDVRRLFDSIAKGYPIGNLLLWERGAPHEQIQLGALDIDASEGTALFVVDGQQRVTSLASALTLAGSSDERFSLAFNLEKEEFERYEQGAPSHLVPLHVIFDLEKLIPWFAEHGELKGKLERATKVAKAIRQYTIPSYVVKQQDEQVLRDIFDRMNNYGMRLTRAEVFSALHGGTANDGSNLHFSNIAEVLNDETRFGMLDDATLLKAVMARRSWRISRDIRAEFDEGNASKDFSDEDAASAYREGRRALIDTIRFLQNDAGVPHLGFLPYRYLIVVLTRFFGHYPTPSLRNRTLLRRFFWRAILVGPSVFTGITPATNALGACIRADDESESVQRLLEELRPHKWIRPGLKAFFTRAAQSRVILCALWSLGPISPVDGTKYDLETITSMLLDESNATAAIQMFFPRAPEGVRGWAANRAILLAEVSDVAGDAASAFIEGAKGFDARTHGRILKSHAMDRSMLALLEQGEAERFLDARNERLSTVLDDFIKRVAEPDLEDTPPLEELDLDDDQGHDDETGE